MTLVRVTAPHFCAGLIVRNGVVTGAAPIIRWAMGKPWTEVERYCNKKRWKVELFVE
jgi:hypothetical protein